MGQEVMTRRLAAPPRSSRVEPLRRSRADRIPFMIGGLGLVLLAALFVIALFPEAIAPHDPTKTVGRPFQPPDAQFWLGTNDIGQDLFSELIWGTRASLLTGLTVSLVAVSVGTVVGLLSGYFSDLLSILLLRLVDLTLVLPFLPLIVLLSAYLGPSQQNVIIVLVLVSWAAPARFIRSRVLVTLNEPYIKAARSLGASDWRILRYHIWPSVRTLVLVQLVLVAAGSILAEASLSFLGLGDLSTKSWGTMLYFAQVHGVFLSDTWRWWVFPTGAMISLTVLSLVLLAYAIEHRLEPRRLSR